jgi:hypothetical protein
VEEYEVDEEMVDAEVVDENVTRLSDASTSDASEDADTLEIEAAKAQIEQTRAEMSDTIEAIKEKLNPQHLVEHAKESLHDATIGRAQDAASATMETARGACAMMMQTIRENPVPAAMAGIGLGWLWMSGRKANGRTQWRYDAQRTFAPTSDYDTLRTPYPAAGQRWSAEPESDGALQHAQEMVGQVAEQVKQSAAQLGEKAQQGVAHLSEEAQQSAASVSAKAQQGAAYIGAKAHEGKQRAAEGFQDLLERNPLALGAVALALGLALGYALPETRVENRLMGETRDNVVDSAKETAREVVDTAKETAREVAGKVETAAREAIDTAKQEMQTTSTTIV